MPSRRRRILLVTFAALCLGVLSPACFSEQSENADLKSLYDSHRWFELRDAVAKGAAPAFFKGAVACAFNDLRRCESQLRRVLKAHTGSDQSVEAHRLLASTYLRRGQYRDALAQVDALLAIRPGDPDAGNDRPLLAALGTSPDQEITGRRSTTVQLQDAGLPISINGVAGTYWFDTGADLSALSESDARRFGLRVLPAAIKEGDVTGTRVDSRIAIADELSVGTIRVRHVAFLVFSDEQPPFNQMPAGSRGLVGLPVLLALQRFLWSADKKFEIGVKSLSKRNAHADLCFNGNSPVAQIQFQGRNLAFTLDTGATNTDLYPPFAEAFPELIREAEKTDSYKMEGVGGAKSMNAAVLSAVHFSIGDFPAVLKPANVLLAHTTNASKFFYGNLGIDLLQQAQKVTFDFQAMTLTLQ
jgi:predicted aspartyl protease